MKINNIRVMKDTGLDTRLDADKNANGMAKKEPIIVPKKAIEIVSTNKYGTPPAKSNNSSRSGFAIPVRMLSAILTPLCSRFSKFMDDNDQMNRSAMIKETTVI